VREFYIGKGRMPVVDVSLVSSGGAREHQRVRAPMELSHLPSVVPHNLVLFPAKIENIEEMQEESGGRSRHPWQEERPTEDRALG
jgi:hypothetical protein